MSTVTVRPKTHGVNEHYSAAGAAACPETKEAKAAGSSLLIRTATADDVPTLATIHTEGLPHEFLVRLGRPFLTKVFFPGLLESPSARIYVADESKQVVGFVITRVGLSGMVGEILAHHPIRFVGTCIFAFLRRPRLLRDCLSVFTQLRTRKSLAKEEGTGELVLMAVAKRARRRGIARALVQYGIAQLQAAGVTSCRLIYYTDNESVDALYRSLGYAERKVYRFGDHWWREREVKLTSAGT